MSVTSKNRGNTTYYDQDAKAWKYADGAPTSSDRPCPRCGQYPTPEGHDACIGYIPGVASACCGHGLGQPYVIVAPIRFEGLKDFELIKIFGRNAESMGIDVGEYIKRIVRAWDGVFE